MDGANNGPLGRIRPGARVRVRSRFDGRWADGFEVSSLERGTTERTRYRVRRVTDRRVLPSSFGEDEVVPTEFPGFAAQFWPGLP